MLELRHIAKQFAQKKILKDINATIHNGDFIIMVGANGSGKSTLFNIISGALQPDSGSVIMHNKDITTTNDIERTQWISQLFQNPRVNTVEEMTVAENISLALMKGHSAGLKKGQKAYGNDLFIRIKKEYNIDITPLLQKKMASLSGGQRQLIAFIMATITIPELLLLDEPTAALDPQAATTLLTSAYRFIKDHKVTTILVTHDPLLALATGNKLWVLHDGFLHQYDQEQKKGLVPQDLIGQIDYQQIRM